MLVINCKKFCDKLACLSSDTDWIRDESFCHLKAISHKLQEAFNRGETITNEEHTFVWDKAEFAKHIREIEQCKLRYSKYLRALSSFAFEDDIER